ncbi:MAG: TrkA family potassium uptake protein [Deltaproteobacteria bacterium]|nr:TrkA family potassium uptake protein [Deltaproteobacteria bacterium]
MRVLLVGFGAFGLWFARTLRETGHEVVAIERDGALVDRYAEWADRAIMGDATDPAVLTRAGAREVDAAVIGTSEALATTILTTVALRDLGVKAIYAKVRSENEARALEGLDITEAVFPEREAAFRLAHRIATSSVLQYTPIAPGYSVQEMAIPNDWVGKSILAIDPRTRLGVQVIAVRDALTGEFKLPPDPTALLKPSDSLVLAGGDETLADLAKG